MGNASYIKNRRQIRVNLQPDVSSSIAPVRTMSGAVVDHGYLAATNREKFTLVKSDGFRCVEGGGRIVVDAVGNRHEPDIIILANGFKTQDLLTPLSIYGQDGKDLRSLWRSFGGAEAYMG